MLKCQYCNNDFSKRNLSVHIRTQHTHEYVKDNDSVLLCPICNAYAASDITQHVLKTHKIITQEFREKYNMNLIHYSVSSGRAFSKHKTEKNRKGVYCELCDQVLPSKKMYDEHFYKYDAKHTQVVFNNSNQNEWVECQICGYRAATLVPHLKFHHPEISSREYLEKYGEGSLKTIELVNKTTNDNCKTNFINKMRKFIIDGYFDMDGFLKFNQTKNYKLPMLYCNTVLKVPIQGYVKCPVCHYSLNDRADLSEHFIRNQNDEKHYLYLKDNILDNEKKGLSRLKIQDIVDFRIDKILKYFGLWKTMSESRPKAWVRPVECEHCGKIVSVVSLRMHLYYHHKDLYEWIYCHICNRPFLNEKGLRDHIGLKEDEQHQKYFLENYEKTILEKFDGVDGQDYISCKHPDCIDKLIRDYNLETHIVNVHKIDPCEYKKKYGDYYIGRRTGFGVICLASDGHKCFSYLEKIVDDWLYKNKINHTPQKRLGIGNKSCDQYIEMNKKGFIEVDGIGLKRRDHHFFDKMTFYRDLFSKGEVDWFLVVNEFNYEENFIELFFKDDLIYDGEYIEIEAIENYSYMYRLKLVIAIFRYYRNTFNDDYSLKQVILNKLGFNELVEGRYPCFFQFDDKTLIQKIRCVK